MENSEEAKEKTPQMPNVMHTVLPISIVIPAYCEESTLPKLLESIKNQYIQPLEVIVADAHSTDKTREIALTYGATVVEGGAISFGRNRGAEVAKAPYLLFLDADTELPTDTILAEAFVEFIKKDLDIASVGFKPDKQNATFFSYLAGGFVFHFNNVIQKVQTLFRKVVFACGAFVLVKRDTYVSIHGFDETYITAEDSDFFRRAVKAGFSYGHLQIKIITSTRRYRSLTRAIKMLGGLWLVLLFISFMKRKGKKLEQWSVRNYGKLGGGDGVSPWKET